jgi:BASS family bile acid:Na+ symporter
MFTYFSKGNVSLSLLLTFLTTLFSVGMTPLLLKGFGVFIPPMSRLHEVTLPLANLSGTLALALIPVIIGLMIRLYNKAWAWYPKTQEILQTQDLRVFSAAGLLSFSGILCSLILCLVFKAHVKTARTLSFETGIQNAPLAFAIISLNMPQEIALAVGWIPLVYGALSVANAAFFTLAYRFSAKIKP